MLANVSKKDAEISENERKFAHRYLKDDIPVWDLSHRFLDQTLDRAFKNQDDRESALAEFKDRCARRHHNFHPPRPKGQPANQADANAEQQQPQTDQPQSKAV